MSNDKMREEFEVKFPLPAGVAWKDSIGMYEVVDIWKLDKPATIGMYNWLWEGWQASRALIVIELPPSPEVPEDPEDAIDDSHMDAYHSAVQMRKDCSKAIKAAGLKVKP
ncbi:hypothetical protein LZ023_26755 [Pseudomonas silvicola]|nr:hypothetical protein LZ023_26755 [Pseudomonas silvicola]